MSDVEYRCQDGIGFITLNRPAKLNALTDEGVLRFAECLQELDEDDDALVGLIHGEGSSFCAGGDVKSRVHDSLDAGVAGYYRANLESAFSQAVNAKPLVSAVHGYVLGKGLSAAFHSEIVVAAEDTLFQWTELALNIAATRYLALIAFRTGDAFAMDVGLSGRYWNAQEALASGLVNRVVPAGEHLAAAEEIARQVTAMPPMAVRATVRMRRSLRDEYVLRSASLTPEFRFDQTSDFEESIKARVEKRQPKFIGR